MIAIISPAKSLDFQSPVPSHQVTQPRFAGDAAGLAAAAARLGAEELGALMRISPRLAELNARRFERFEEQPERPALFAFAGDVYTGLEAKSLDREAILYAQDHLRILSGLYGLLRPLDLIRPYRLEMGTRWSPNGRSLLSYWSGRIAALLETEMEEAGAALVVNLASKEYWAAVEGRLPPRLRVIDIDFREQGPQGLRFNSFAAKRARGMMARYICEHRIEEPEALKGFDSDGYRFDPHGSEGDTWRFTRH